MRIRDEDPVAMLGVKKINREREKIRFIPTLSNLIFLKDFFLNYIYLYAAFYAFYNAAFNVHVEIIRIEKGEKNIFARMKQG